MLLALTPHLIIPFASCSGEAWAKTMQTMASDKLKNLRKLLQGMKLVEVSNGQADSLSTPNERVLADAYGLEATPDGLLPWAALEAVTHFGTGAIEKAWAFVRPCHWAMGREQATMSDPAMLGISELDSKTLLAAMQPYFETEGITLHYLSPERWLADGELFRVLPTASIDRVLGRNVDLWLPGSSGATAPGAAVPQADATLSKGSALQKVKSAGTALRLLQNEMQMLLYTHAVNDARSDKRQQTINSFWLSGTGALQKGLQNRPTTDITLPRSLAQAALNDDWDAYSKAWATIDEGEVAQFLALQNAGTAVRLSLCGESHAQTFASSTPSIFARISSVFRPQPPINVLQKL